MAEFSSGRGSWIVAAAVLAFLLPVLAPTSAAAWWDRGHGWHAGWRPGWGFRPGVVIAGPPLYGPPPPVVYAPRPPIWIRPHWNGPYWIRGHWA